MIDKNVNFFICQAIWPSVTEHICHFRGPRAKFVETGSSSLSLAC